MNDNNMTREPGGRDWLAALLLRQPDRFMPRFAAALARWQTLSRGFRKRFARRVAATAAGAALILALAGSPLLVPSARAATITVDGVTCTLIDAITAANSDTATGGCIAGDAGLDTIDLQADVTLTAAVGDYIGYTGLPAVISEIVIEGNGFTIERDGAAPEFRILFIAATGDLTLNNVTISGGKLSTLALNGGGVYVREGTLRVFDSAITGNEAEKFGGGIANYNGDVTIGRSYFYGNYAGDEGGGVSQYEGTMTILESTFTGNVAIDDGGAILNYYGMMTIVNSTFSGNVATAGGAIYNDDDMTIVNSTLTGNEAYFIGGGIFNLGMLTLSRSIVSGNSAGNADEIANTGSLTADDYNVISHDGLTSGAAFTGFTPGATDINAGSDAADIPLTDILDTTLADNGGPTPTHNLVDDSPAVDLAPDADCVAPSLTGGIDQRGAARPFDVAGQGNDGTDTCDAGAVEFNSPVPGGTAVYMSATTAGTTDDAVAFGPEDILEWNDGDWSLFFDGSAAGLVPTGKWKHNINAFHIDAGGDIVMSFTQNARFVPGIVPKVDGMDLVKWDGSTFTLWFDGSDVGLTNKTQEKIDALHILPGSESPVGGGCIAYLLVSTQGPGKVKNAGEPSIRFGGEDVLGFCMTNSGAATAGWWHLLLDGSAEGMPRNATDSISFSDDGQTMYLTTKGAFNVDAAAGGHSMVYKYEFGSGSFSGPFFSAPAEGLPRKVDGLQVVGELP